jgi:hypothetical protein
LLPLFATGVADNGGKFTISVFDIGGNFTPGIVNTPPNLQCPTMRECHIQAHIFTRRFESEKTSNWPVF